MDPTDLYAFSIGPIETHAQTGLVFLGLFDGRLLGPTEAHEPEAALAELAAQVPEGTGLTCCADLVDLAPQAGFRCGPEPSEAVALRAMLAMVLAHGGGAPQAEEELRPLILAAARFWTSRPWERLPADKAFIVEARGRERRTYECCILGGLGMDFGILLYPQPGSVRRIVEILTSGDPTEARRIDMISFTLDKEPVWACRAVEAWCDLPRVPITFGLTGGRIRAVTAGETLVLAATLDATAGMTGDPLEVGSGRAATDDADVTVSVLALPASSPEA